MAMYMVQFTYTADAWDALVKNPQDRTIPSRNLVQALGGKLLGLYYSMGEYDGVALFDVPDDISASAVSLTVKASGIMKENLITRIFTMDEAMEAMRKAGSSSFSGPKK
ncbi:MAG TPA: GYD domain-containing protein [Dictyobacter sp.]|nr:GYD domain-containing protein [Dictyobacter sp.]